MRIATLGLCAMMGLGVWSIGCDESSSTTPKVETKTATDTGSGMLDKVKDGVADVKEKTAEAAANATDKAKDAAADAKEQAGDAASALTAQAQKLFDDAKAAIGKADFDGAQKYVDQLKGLQDKLPAEWKAKIDDLVKMIADAKEKLKAVPGMPK